MSRRAVSCRSVLKSQDKAGGSCPVVPRHIEPFVGKLVGRHERRRMHASGVETRWLWVVFAPEVFASQLARKPWTRRTLIAVGLGGILTTTPGITSRVFAP